MLLLLVGACALIGSAGCDPTTTPPSLAGALGAGGGSPLSATTAGTTEPSSASTEVDPVTEDTSPVTAEPQASVTLDQMVEEVFDLYQTTTRAVLATPLSELAKTLANIQASVAAVSTRVDLVHNAQLQQQKDQNNLEKRLEAIERSQTETASRLDAIAQSQSEAASRQEAIQSTADRLEEQQQRPRETVSQVIQETQSDLSRDLSARFDAVEASQSSLSSKVDTILQHLQQRSTAPAVEGSVQEQLDAIQADISRIPKLILGQPCSSNTECSRMLPEATCGAGGLCSCRDGYRQVSDILCRRHSRLSDLCLEHADCRTLVANSSCTSGVCSCVDGFWNYNNAECRPVGAVDKGGSCVGNDDCDSGSIHRCVSGTCSCLIKQLGDYEYRLAGAPSCKEGRVELRRSGSDWGLVCDDDWSGNDALVLCRSLGYGSGRATIKSRYGRGTNFYMDDVNCNGSESQLTNCGYRGWGSHNCGAGEVAGVRCQD